VRRDLRRSLFVLRLTQMLRLIVLLDVERMTTVVDGTRGMPFVAAVRAGRRRRRRWVIILGGPVLTKPRHGGASTARDRADLAADDPRAGGFWSRRH
jgi:hypothetical protein